MRCVPWQPVPGDDEEEVAETARRAPRVHIAAEPLVGPDELPPPAVELPPPELRRRRMMGRIPQRRDTRQIKKVKAMGVTRREIRQSTPARLLAHSSVELLGRGGVTLSRKSRTSRPKKSRTSRPRTRMRLLRIFFWRMRVGMYS